MIGASHTIRIARPSTDLAAAERFYCEGLGLDVLFRGVGDPEAGTHDLLMVGPRDARWHLELTVGTRETVLPSPTPEDLLVIYLDAPVSRAMVDRAVAHGGTVVAAHNPYWDHGGVTIADPDGYRVVLTERCWGLNKPLSDRTRSGDDT
ncbi:VOC family protein [Streptomyces thermodiastaticus]|uniref:VOC family protein n=1 Tax=Streptomyces thermodiastaticus TaxID=44061 RepID=UPI0016787D05|nr:VOC family protein [Streptomyces thermodiastaticus]MCE7549072.1 VOC family protein [Streptomyces thermodiastaticus]GHF59911.1 glyoxalase/bleomycin resistance protein/dioxygenase [Streptomyces thermodiastaticus]